MKNTINSGVMLNAYPDSMGGTVGDIVDVLSRESLRGVFESFYILPSIFNTDLDRGFSIIDYGINELYATNADFDNLKKMGVNFKFDFVLNHLSVLSPQFQDIVKKGEKSNFKDFFINWNEFWDGKGNIEEDGVLRPKDEYIKDMFFRKPSLPVLNVRYPDGSEVPYWNTFYQEVKYIKVTVSELINVLGIQYLRAEKLMDSINESIDKGLAPKEMDLGQYGDIKKEIVNLLESKREYLGQMDLNIKSDLVWNFYEDTIKKLASYGAKIVRLDAFAYSSKEVGKRNFFNVPDTWDDLEKIRQLAENHNIALLPEIHSTYEEKLHEEICEKGYMTYDFFLPGLIINALEMNTSKKLLSWMKEIKEKDMKVVNMLGCHDGIPLLDLKGLLSEDEIKDLIDVVVSRGGYVKELHGKKNMYYQVNATYYSALGEDDKKLALARAIQIFSPGKPQVWYLDLFAGTNDYEALKNAGAGGHKEINRTNLRKEDIAKSLEKEIVKEQIKLLEFRNSCEAFGFDAQMTIREVNEETIDITWSNNGVTANLLADLKSYDYTIMCDGAIK